MTNEPAPVQPPSRAHFYKLGASALAFLYAAHCMADAGGWHVIDSVDLIFHEAGHTLFSLFGETLYIAGGSIFQVLVPLAFVAYFVRQAQLFSASVVTYWAAISAANVSRYAGDALAMKLPLITGDTETHDWNNLLFRLGLLHDTKLIAGIIMGFAVLLLCVGLLLALYAAYKEMGEPADVPTSG